MKSLSEKTSVPLGWIYGVLTLSVGGIATAIAITLYLSRTEAKAQSAANEVKELRSTVDRTMQDINSSLNGIDRRLSRIEGRLKQRLQEDEE